MNLDLSNNSIKMDLSNNSIKMDINKILKLDFKIDFKLIPYKTIVDLLRVTMLVYDYGDNFELENLDQTIENFTSKINENPELCTKLNLSDFRKEVLCEIGKCNPSGKLYKFISDKKTDIQVGITINDKERRICVVFRGSESLYDWYYDINIGKHKLNNNIMVHRGFYKQLHDTNVYNDILQEIKFLLDKNHDYDIFITGHSLGAALSTLFGYLLSHEIINNVIVVSFASPRVGNAEWKKSFENKSNLQHYRVTNCKDIVTALPYFNYKHVGHNIRLFENNVSTYLDYSDNSWYDFSIFRCWSVNDHNSELYYKHLLNNKW